MPEHDLIGKMLGRYQILEHLGQGGMAQVYKAYQPSLDRYVAIKILHAFLLQEPGSRDRFQREARTVASLRHPSIVQVYDFDAVGDLCFMVMEYIDGPNLKEVLQEQAALGTRLPLERVEEIATTVGNALAYAHRRGMIHRDVKPHNIMFTSAGQPLLADFGIAKILSSTASISDPRVISGTPAYMSPEQGRGMPLDARTDLYSLGVVLYEMLSGRVPFDADTPFAVVIKHINDPLPPLHYIVPGLPPVLERVVFKAMAKSPDDRYQSADEMVRAVQEAIAKARADTSAPIPVPMVELALAVAPEAVHGATTDYRVTLTNPTEVPLDVRLWAEDPQRTLEISFPAGADRARLGPRESATLKLDVRVPDPALPDEARTYPFIVHAHARNADGPGEVVQTADTVLAYSPPPLVVPVPPVPPVGPPVVPPPVTPPVPPGPPPADTPPEWTGGSSGTLPPKEPPVPPPPPPTSPVSPVVLGGALLAAVLLLAVGLVALLAIVNRPGPVTPTPDVPATIAAAVAGQGTQVALAAQATLTAISVSGASAAAQQTAVAQANFAQEATQTAVAVAAQASAVAAEAAATATAEAVQGAAQALAAQQATATAQAATDQVTAQAIIAATQQAYSVAAATAAAQAVAQQTADAAAAAQAAQATAAAAAEQTAAARPPPTSPPATRPPTAKPATPKPPTPKPPTPKPPTPVPPRPTPVPPTPVPPPPPPVPPTPEPPPPSVGGIVNYQADGVAPAQLRINAGQSVEFLSHLDYGIEVETYGDSPEGFRLSLAPGTTRSHVFVAAGTYNLRRADLPADAQWYVTINVR